MQGFSGKSGGKVVFSREIANIAIFATPFFIITP